MPEVPENPESQIKCLALIRGQSLSAVKTAMCDLDRHAHLIITGKPRVCEPVFADNILIKVMDEPLKRCCIAAAVVGLEDHPLDAICRIKKIHAPAHVVIVSPDHHDIYNDVLNTMDMLPELDLTRQKKKEEGNNGA